ncbi:MAG: DUF262 domain-containing protein [Planctomycetaceae bacterium]|jgi:hypothetical protein|nr:DUF262 domain-containing protein [Planctomycetaceae bacterium]
MESKFNKTDKYSIRNWKISQIINSKDIVIPEIQRPFVWNATKVRDLLDSLYQGYPIGYVVTWLNHDVQLKGGGVSKGETIIIDGQQRIKALQAALLGHDITDSNYETRKIKIAFHPIEARFEVQNSAILKDKKWLPDISEVIRSSSSYSLVKNYLKLNPDVDEATAVEGIERLDKIPEKTIGLIELSAGLEIETITEIFIRINSAGTALSQADFVMSKIVSNKKYKGSELGKAIDYFCHLAEEPDFYKNIVKDKEFTETDFFRKIQWLKDEKDDLYNPKYTDLLRVAFTSQFNRGDLSDLVSLLSGRNFETRSYEDTIAEQSFATLKKGVLNFVNESNFNRFLMFIKSAGFIAPQLIQTQNALNFAYIVYLKLKELKYAEADIGKYVCRWFVYTILTGHFSRGAESSFDKDIRHISTKPFDQLLKEHEDATLSDTYWNTTLVQNLDTSVANSPLFRVFLAAQVKANTKGFLSDRDIVRNLIENRSDIHHLFPRDYLKKNGFERTDYNQIANYACTQAEINRAIGNSPPQEYFELVRKQMQTPSKKERICGISSEEELQENLKENCIPKEITNMDFKNYKEFLALRRKLMAEKIKEYYFSL